LPSAERSCCGTGSNWSPADWPRHRSTCAWRLDNVFIERLWRSLKDELIYPGDFVSGADLFPALDRYFHFYNYQRPHQAPGYRTPADLFPLRSTRKRSSP
jgi:transposase InsO family protein